MSTETTDTARRAALIVATDEYADGRLRRLRAPARDAEALAAVLGDPTIGGFEVEVVANGDERQIRRQIAGFLSGLHRDDLAVLHLSCHGIKDDDGQLYFAAADTDVANLDSTAVSAEFLTRQMTRTSSRKVVLFLDCCYSGAFARGMFPRAGDGIELKERFEGYGRIVLTASWATEYACEGDDISGSGSPSIFTAALVEGLRSGEADTDMDGVISIDELYDFVHDRVRRAAPSQSPSKWVFGTQGDVIVARSTRQIDPLAALPEELRVAADSEYPGVREGAVRTLAAFLSSRNAVRAQGARELLARLVDDDSRRVSIAAVEALSGTAEADAPSTTIEPRPPAPPIVEPEPPPAPPITDAEPAPPIAEAEPSPAPPIAEPQPSPAPPAAPAPAARRDVRRPGQADGEAAEQQTDRSKPRALAPKLAWRAIAVLAALGTLALFAANAASHTPYNERTGAATAGLWLAVLSGAAASVLALVQAARPTPVRWEPLAIAALTTIPMTEWDYLRPGYGPAAVHTGGLLALGVALVWSASIAWQGRSSLLDASDRRRLRFLPLAGAVLAAVGLLAALSSAPGEPLKALAVWMAFVLLLVGGAGAIRGDAFGLRVALAAALAFAAADAASVLDGLLAGHGFTTVSATRFFYASEAIWAGLAVLAVRAVTERPVAPDV